MKIDKDKESCLNCRFNTSKCCAGFIHNTRIAKNVRCQLYERYTMLNKQISKETEIEYKQMSLDEIEYD